MIRGAYAAKGVSIHGRPGGQAEPRLLDYAAEYTLVSIHGRPGGQAEPLMVTGAELNDDVSIHGRPGGQAEPRSLLLGRFITCFNPRPPRRAGRTQVASPDKE